MSGYNEMLRRIEPEAIICYHEPFPEMTGNIVYVNYELSSWQHMDDDLEDFNHTKNTVEASYASGCQTVKYGYVESAGHSCKGYPIVKHNGYVVQLGAGSAYGGNWVPSKEADERFLGEPNSINHYDTEKYEIDTKIGESGRAEMERHYTDHGYPKYHSSPHDHIINYNSDGSPNWNENEQINYFDGDVPEFKAFYTEVQKMGKFIKPNPDDNTFKSIADFQDCMRRGGEVEFQYNKKIYSIIHALHPLITIGKREDDNKPVIEDSIIHFDSSDKLLDYIIEGKKLREIITDVQVLARTI